MSTIWYRTGTVTLTQGSDVLLSTGSLFTTNVKTGDMFIGPNMSMYEVKTIVTDNHIVLATPWVGATYTGTDWSIAPTSAQLKGLAKQITELIALYQDLPQLAAEVTTGATAAQASVIAAAASASTASQAATTAQGHRDSAATSASNASDSAIAAATSATNANTSATNASQARTDAQTAATASAASAASAKVKTVAGREGDVVLTGADLGSNPTFTGTPSAAGLNLTGKLSVATGGVEVTGAAPAIATGASRVNVGVLNGLPAIRMVAASGGADEKLSDIHPNVNNIRFRLVNDADNAAQNWLVVNRIGMTVSSISWPQGTMSMNGAVSVVAPTGIPLDARSPTNGYYVYGRNTTTGHYLALSSDATGPRLEFGNGAGLRFGDGATDRVWLGVGGATLGIGISPAAPLHAVLTSNTTYSSADMMASGVVSTLRNMSTTNGTAGVIRLEATGSASNAVTGIAAVHVGDGASALTFGTRANAASSIAEGMRLRGASLGLGYAPPAYGAGINVVGVSAAIQAVLDVALDGVRQGTFTTDGTIVGMGSVTNKPVVVFQNGTEHSRFNSSGLGIGVAATCKLDVFGNYIFARDGTYAGYFGKGSDLVLGAGAADLGIRTSTGNICFGTSTGIERMRVPSGGGLFVGTSTGIGSGAHVSISSGGNAIHTNSPIGSIALGVHVNGTYAGGVVTTSASTISFNTSSDRRLKENIEDARSSGDLLDSIRVRTFNFKSDPDKIQQVGFVAQELFEVYPDAVTPGEIGDAVNRPWGVDFSKLVPLLVKEVQELRKRVAVLEPVPA
ncbi:tail fiber domain-containing protein [Rhizobacter sp. Root1221]|uniref:tail fiber domain-containing protein n=1 Tax=Rhizobacter sp. Root1221 TaxID=1736433 RepID=UPI0006F9B05C|nr:tail fiber domain-containing protein [Rhizobacter sp. Root1221]KQV99960.1 hypothetical protein ASC87_19865 [Rhizobacter sp. Root1221]